MKQSESQKLQNIATASLKQYGLDKQKSWVLRSATAHDNSKFANSFSADFDFELKWITFLWADTEELVTEVTLIFIISFKESETITIYCLNKGNLNLFHFHFFLSLMDQRNGKISEVINW